MLVFPGEDFKDFQEMILRIPQSNCLLCNSSLQRVSKKKNLLGGFCFVWVIPGEFGGRRGSWGKKERKKSLI